MLTELADEISHIPRMRRSLRVPCDNTRRDLDNLDRSFEDTRVITRVDT